MRRSIKKISRIARYLLGFLFIATLALGFTSPGLNLLTFVANKTFDIKIARSTGYLLGRFTLNDIRFNNSHSTITIAKIKADYSLWSLLKLSPKINQLDIHKAVIQHQLVDNKTTKDEPFDINKLTLPYFNLKQLHVTNSVVTINSHTYRIPKLTLQARNNRQALELAQLDGTIEGTHFRAFGQLRYEANKPLTLSMKSTGQISQQTQIKGDIERYTLSTSINAPYRAKISGHLAKLNQFSLDVAIANAIIKPLNQTHIKDSTFTIGGNIHAYHYRLSANTKQLNTPWLNTQLEGRGSLNQLIINTLSLSDGQGKLRGEAKISLQPSLSWKANFRATNFNLADFNPALTSQINGNILSKGAYLSSKWLIKNTIRAEGRLLNQPLMAGGQINFPGSSKINIKLGQNSMKLQGDLLKHAQLNLTVPDTSKIHPSLNTLKSRLTISGFIGRQTSLIATLNGGSLSLDGQHKLNFSSVKSKVRYNNNQARINADIAINNKNNLALSLSSHINQANPLRSPINGNIRANFNDLSILDKLLTEIDKTKGQLKANIKLFGQLSNPMFSIRANLNNGQTFVKPLNLLFKPITLNINSSHHNWRLQGRLVTRGQPLIIRGNGLTDFDASHYHFTVNGNKITLVDNKEFLIKASPSLTIQSKAHHLYLKGKVSIDEARVSPTDFSSSDEISDDIIIVKGGKKIQKPQLLDLDLNIHLGDKVKLDIFGLKGGVKGNLRVHSNPGEVVAATGHIKIVKGRFNAYGRHLKITQGELLYHGGPINNPLLELTAVRVFRASGGSQSLNLSNNSSNVTSLDNINRLVVGIRANGRARKPKITLFANPGGMSQADILSMIVLGRPAHQAGNTDGGGDLLVGALSALNLGGGTSGQQLTDELQHNLGFNVSMETQTNFNEDGGITNSPALVLSKSISSKIQLQYSAGFGEGSNIIRILYNFKKNWSLITETSGNGTGFDVLYNYQRQ